MSQNTIKNKNTYKNKKLDIREALLVDDSKFGVSKNISEIYLTGLKEIPREDRIFQNFIKWMELYIFKN